MIYKIKVFLTILLTLGIIVSHLLYSSILGTAEGSKQLLNSGGNRPFIEFRNDSIAGISRRTTLQVYAKNGETINLGSSANGVASGRINYINPSGTSGQCATNVGTITNITQENAGPLPNSGGYTPCVITVNSSTEGIWQVTFVSPNQSSTANPTPISVTASWTQPNNVSYIAAWDITVRNSGGSEIKGRTYANYIAWNMGSGTSALSSKVYVLSKDAYKYVVDLNGIQPFGFIFFSNNDGVTDLAGNPTRKSVQLNGINPNFTLPSQYNILKPFEPDTSTQFTNKIFFEPPSTDLPATSTFNNQQVWLSGTIPTLPTASTFYFEGVDGTPNTGGTFDEGGNFKFNADLPGNYRIVMDLNGDTIYGNSNDKILEGISSGGSNTVFWDGLDGNGNTLPAGQSNVGIRLDFTAGEVHFPFLDVENNPNGIILQRLNPTPVDYAIYYDDSGLTVGSGTPPNPNKTGLIGINSQTGARSFSGEFGDGRIIDTWALQTNTPISLTGSFNLREADLSVTKTMTSTNLGSGSQVNYTIEVENSLASANDVEGVDVIDNFDSNLTNISWTCNIIDDTSGVFNNSCANPSGTGNINSTVTLNKGSMARYEISATINSNFIGTLANTVTVGEGIDSNDPNLANNTSTTNSLVEGSADLSIQKELLSTSLVSGTTGEYKISVTNNGPIDSAAGFVVRDTLPSELTFNSINNTLSSSGWSCIPNGQLVDCTYNNTLPLNQTIELYIVVGID